MSETFLEHLLIYQGIVNLILVGAIVWLALTLRAYRKAFGRIVSDLMKQDIETAHRVSQFTSLFNALEAMLIPKIISVHTTKAEDKKTSVRQFPKLVPNDEADKPKEDK